MRRFAAGSASALAVLALVAAPAAASRDQESMFQDDALLVYPPIASVDRTLDTLQSMGVDRIRASVYWRLVAPDPNAEGRPSFDATDPAAYSRDDWRRYDDLVRAVYARGMQVDLDVGGPAPRWASQPAPPSNPDLDGVYQPDPGAFAEFFHAVAQRYSGSYAPPAEDVLPRVSYWELWNEPSQKVFLAPQYVNRHEWSPQLYRRFVDGAWQALAATGHGGDTFLVGATAPKGGGERDPLANMRPLRFVRALYCVSPRLRPLRGAAASLLGCPATDQVAAFPAQHPGLFQASGYAHHPYSLLTPPALRARNPDDVAMADIPRLDRTLRRIFAAYRQRNRLPIYSTEFGYQTRPPDPFGFRLARAAAYINQAEFMSYVNPNVRSYHQFLLEDAPPLPGVSASSPLAWSSFQTGLEYGDGTPKPTLAAYRVPIFVPGAVRRRPGFFRVWGGVRPAPNGSAQTVDVLYRRGGRGAWRVIRRVATHSPRNYLDTRVRLSRSGLLRLRWADTAQGSVELSRLVAIRIGR